MIRFAVFVLSVLLSMPVAAATGPAVGHPAPDFTAYTAADETVRLADLKGKIVILEWTNDGCPFVQKHYGAGNMQALQNEMTFKGIVWAQVLSSEPGSQGHADAKTAIKLNVDRGAKPTHVFLDPAGVIGRAYMAKTTPHMFVIDPKGILVYMGAIDSNPSADPADIVGAENYVRSAVADLEAGHPVKTPVTKPYGCGVKYAG